MKYVGTSQKSRYAIPCFFMWLNEFSTVLVSAARPATSTSASPGRPLFRSADAYPAKFAKLKLPLKT